MYVTPLVTSIERYFGEVPDPHPGQNVQHPLLSLINIAICGVICGADSWVDIEIYGQSKREWLACFLELPHDIASHDTFGRVFRQLNSGIFQAHFREWTQAICTLTDDEYG